MLVCVHIFFTFSICINTPLQLKACKVNTFYIEEDVLKGCFKGLIYLHLKKHKMSVMVPRWL